MNIVSSSPEASSCLSQGFESRAGNDLNKFPIWVEELKAYLEHHDPRFKELLEQIEEAKTPIDPQDSLNIALKIGAVQSKEALDRNLLGYLKAFTSGEALKLITKLGKEKVYEAFRQLCEAGRSRRPEHIAAIRLRVQQPRQLVPILSLMSTILDWEQDMMGS